MPDNIYKKQAELLLRLLPLVMRKEVFDGSSKKVHSIVQK
jgi:hypothetical protein